MSEVIYFERGGHRIPIRPPSDVSGFATSAKDIRREKSFLLTSGHGMEAPYTGMRSLLGRGTHAISSMSAGHDSVIAQHVRPYVPQAGVALQRARQRYESALRASGLEAQGEANRNLPDRGSFSADKRHAKKTEHRVSHIESFSRGDQVVHTAGHTRMTIMGPSRSKPGYYKAVDLEGNEFRVHPRNLTRLR